MPVVCAFLLLNCKNSDSYNWRSHKKREQLCKPFTFFILLAELYRLLRLRIRCHSPYNGSAVLHNEYLHKVVDAVVLPRLMRQLIIA